MVAMPQDDHQGSTSLGMSVSTACKLHNHLSMSVYLFVFEGDGEDLFKWALLSLNCLDYKKKYIN